MKACGITDVGLQRHENQDTFAVERGAADGQLVAVVCDGMGGENCGQIASSLAVRAFLDELHAVLRADMTTEQLREAVSFCVSKANAAVNRHAQEHTECHGMGTTLVSAVTNGSGAVICNVGDSRAYRVGTGRLERITRDHSVVEGLIAGAHAPKPQSHHPRARPRGAYRVRRIRCDARRGRAAAALLGRAGRHRHGRGDVRGGRPGRKAGGEP